MSVQAESVDVLMVVSGMEADEVPMTTSCAREERWQIHSCESGILSPIPLSTYLRHSRNAHGVHSRRTAHRVVVGAGDGVHGHAVQWCGGGG